MKKPCWLCPEDDCENCEQSDDKQEKLEGEESE